jgi:hypothetical protein
MEKARVLLPPTLDQFMAVYLIAANLENVLQLLVLSAISKAPQPTRTLYSALIANVFATNAAWLTD